MKIQCTRLAGLFAAVCMTVIASRASQGEDYNAAAQYSATNNPNGTWSYGFITSGDLNLNNYMVFPVAPVPAQEDWNNGSTDPNVGSGVGSLLLGPFNGPSVVQWTAPRSGPVELTSSGANDQVCCGDTERPTNYVVMVNGSQVFSQKLSSLGSSATYDAALYVTQGEKIDFIAYNGNEGDNNSLTLAADIGFVPEPSPLVALCGLGAAGMLLALRRRRK